MDRLSHVPLDLLLTNTEGVHDQSGPHPYDESENTKIPKTIPPNPGKRRVPISLVPGGGASAFSTEGGDDTQSRAAS